MLKNFIDSDLLLIQAGRWENNSWVWDLKWRRDWFEWERSMVETFKLEVTKILPIKNRLDRWVWKGGNSENYSFRFVYDLLHSINVVYQEKFSNDIWKVHIVSKAKTLIWKIGLIRIQTKLNLQNRGMVMGTNLCTLCQQHVEFIQHLFF